MKTILTALFVLSSSVAAHGFGGGFTNHIYGANVGWIFTGISGGNGPVIGEFYCTGTVYSANCGWISFGNPGGPANGYAYSNLGADYGVNNIGGGQLSGMAYGANIGWITFEQTYGQPRVDLHTGILSGYAYSANCGWMSFNSVIADMKITSLSPGPLDGNGLPIAWEEEFFGMTGIDPNADPDGDDMSNAQEYQAGTNPTDPNSNLRITAVNANTIGSAATLTWTSVPSRLYYVNERTNLTTGAWNTNFTLGAVSPDPGLTTTRGVTESAVTKRFFRVQAVVPLSP